MTNEKDKARLTRIAKQWAATLVGSRHVSDSEVATLAEMLEPLLVTVRRETEAIRDTKLIGRDGFMCEAHPGLEFEHDPDCPGPGMPWVIEGKEAVTQLCRAPVATRVDDGGEWMPIETAPKGIDILLLWEDEHMQIHHFPLMEKPSFWFENAPIKWRHLPPLPHAAAPSPPSQPARAAAEEIGKYLDAFTPLSPGAEVMRVIESTITRHFSRPATSPDNDAETTIRG